MSAIKVLTLSQRYHALAKECRSKAQSFQNEKPRTHMFQLAADYERKATLAESLEATLQTPYNKDASLVPEIFEAFLASSKDCNPKFSR